MKPRFSPEKELMLLQFKKSWIKVILDHGSCALSCIFRCNATEMVIDTHLSHTTNPKKLLAFF